jgi:archaellum component FlaF (FlaF/FlaG flagellin family)
MEPLSVLVIVGVVGVSVVTRNDKITEAIERRLESVSSPESRLVISPELSRRPVDTVKLKLD